MCIGERIRNRREELHMSQEELAGLLGYASRSSINKIEKGINDISQSKIKAFAEALHTTAAYLMGLDERELSVPESTGGLWVPVLGKVQAGVPVEAIEEIIDYEEITMDMASQGDHFGLVVRGDSMEPKFSDGDVIIVRKQNDVESGDIAVVLVNGEEATVKRIKKQPGGILLLPTNPNFEAMFYTMDEVKNLPVTILGRVVELRAKF